MYSSILILFPNFLLQKYIKIRHEMRGEDPINENKINKTFKPNKNYVSITRLSQTKIRATAVCSGKQNKEAHPEMEK